MFTYRYIKNVAIRNIYSCICKKIIFIEMNPLNIFALRKIRVRNISYKKKYVEVHEI